MTSDRPSVRLAGVHLRRGGTGADPPIDFAAHPGAVTEVGGVAPWLRSPLLACMAGVERPLGGIVEVLGGDPARDAAVARRIGYLPADAPLPPDTTPAELLRHLAEVSGAPAPAARVRAADLLDELGLAELRSRPVRDLSSGQRRRVAVAAVLATDPGVAVLDSPTAGLDGDQAAATLAALAAHADRGRTVVVGEARAE